MLLKMNGKTDFEMSDGWFPSSEKIMTIAQEAN